MHVLPARETMRIVVLIDSFPRNMGYIGTMLPKYLARLGADVHVLALDLPPYWQQPELHAHYKRLIGEEWFVPGRVSAEDGYTVHILKHERVGRLVRMPDMRRKLAELAPDVVYSQAAVGPMPLEAALWKIPYGYRLFTGSHMLASGFPFARKAHPWRSREAIKVLLARWIPGRFISLLTENCIAPTIDCGQIAWRFFGVQRRKVRVMHLGVDTDVFFPVSTPEHAAERAQVRRELGVADEELVCIYTGKLTAEKNVLIIAQAVKRLREAGRKFRLVCIGEGVHKDALAKAEWTTVLPFMPYQKLGRYYRASDIAIWPTNESTSMLDAAACGVPLIVSDGIVYRDHVDGNGLVIKMGDLADLVAKLTSLTDAGRRAELGRAGAAKMLDHFSWLAHARRRLDDYEQAVRRKRGS